MDLNEVMCTYLKTVSSSLELNIGNKGTLSSTTSAHNHPPLRFIVPNCPHCAAHGNVFAT